MQPVPQNRPAITNQALGVIVLLFLGGTMMLPLTQPGFLLGNFAVLALLLFGIRVLAVRGALNPRAMGLRPAHLGWILAAIPGALVVFLLIAQIGQSIGPETSESLDDFNQNFVRTQGQREFIFTFLTLAVAIPMLEELIFRGALQTYLARFMPMGFAVLLGALIFALAHTGALSVAADVGDQILMVLILGAVGAMAGVLRGLSGSLLPAIVVHGIYNAMLVYATTLFQAAEAAQSDALPALILLTLP